jgi:putative ABC transport system substrate-binding protein
MAALRAEGSAIPTVFAMVSDPVAMHYVDSFARPGRNVTGFTPFEPSLGGKWVSILKEVGPDIRHLGLVYNPEPGNNLAPFRKSIEETANISASARSKPLPGTVPIFSGLFSRQEISRIAG